MKYREEDESSESAQIIENAFIDKDEDEDKGEDENIIPHEASNVVSNEASNMVSNEASNETLDNVPGDVIDNLSKDTAEGLAVKLTPEMNSTDDSAMNAATGALESKALSSGEISAKQGQENVLGKTEARAIITQATTELSEQKKKLKNKIVIAVIAIAACIAFIGAGFCTIFALINMGSEKILSNVTINDIDVQGLTKDEAVQALSDEYTLWQSKSINLKTEDYAENISSQDIEFTYEIESSVEEAYGLGRSGNLFENNFAILHLLLKGENIISNYTYNQEKLDLIIGNVANTIPHKYVDNSHYVDGKNLFIVKGESGVLVDEEDLKNSVIQTILSKNSDLDVPLLHKEVPELDLEAIYKEVYTEPKDAYYTKANGKYTIYPHVTGVSFDIPSARKALEEKKDEYSIPLKFTNPKTTTSQIGIEAFPDQLASFSTKYNPDQTSRSENLKIASGKINEKVLMPGEVFSYNEVLGKRTIENGFKEAGVYEGNKVVQGVGGGICQVSSTLYNTVLLANLEIIERTNHGLPVGYVPPSQDATVSYGTIDFKFKNNRTYPIKIIAYSTNGDCVVVFYGMKEDVEYEVVIESSIQERTPFTTVYENVSSLSPGSQKVVQNGSDGYKSVAYKVLKRNGNVVSRTLLSTDKYAPINKTIQVGK